MPIPGPEHGPGNTLEPSRRLLTDDVYERLRDDIVRGRLAAGQRIYDLKLADQLGFSRATIRTALLRLTKLGLVETVPNLYTRVTPIDLGRYLKTQDTARALYLFAARYATPVLTDEHIERLQQWSTTLTGTGSIDAETIFGGSPSTGYFRVFLDALDNGPLDRTLARLRPHLQRVMGQYAHLLPADEVESDLRRSVEAAARHDADGAADALAAYYDVGLETFHARLAEQPEFGG